MYVPKYIVSMRISTFVYAINYYLCSIVGSYYLPVCVFYVLFIISLYFYGQFILSNVPWIQSWIKNQ